MLTRSKPKIAVFAMSSFVAALLIAFLNGCSPCSYSYIRGSFIDPTISGKGGPRDGYYFVLNHDYEEAYTDYINKVPLGTKASALITDMGVPDGDYGADGKDIWGDPWMHREVIYYFAIWKKGLSTTNRDRIATLYFNCDDRLVFIQPDCVPGIKTRGNPQKPQRLDANEPFAAP